MPGWRGICEFTRDVRELVRDSWLFMWFLAPVTVTFLALILWQNGLGDLYQAVIDSEFWRLATDTERGAGVMLGIIGGFATLTAGHMINALLTRRRDVQLREQDARALASLLAAEFKGAWNTAQHFRASCLVHETTGGDFGLPPQLDTASAFWLPEFKALDANLARMGILGAELDGEVLRVAAGIRRKIQISLASTYTPKLAAPPSVEDLAALKTWIINLDKMTGKLRARAGLSPTVLKSADLSLAEKRYASQTRDKDHGQIPPDS